MEFQNPALRIAKPLSAIPPAGGEREEFWFICTEEHVINDRFSAVLPCSSSPVFNVFHPLLPSARTKSRAVNKRFVDMGEGELFLLKRIGEKNVPHDQSVTIEGERSFCLFTSESNFCLERL